MRQLDDDLPAEPIKSMDTRFEELWESIGEKMEEMGIETGFVACLDPESGNTRIFFRGHFYDMAKMVHKCAKEMRDQVAEDLG